MKPVTWVGFGQVYERSGCVEQLNWALAAIGLYRFRTRCGSLTRFRE